jgi:hypothetical protein
MMPRYQSDEQWKADAELIVRAVNSHGMILTALRRIQSLDAKNVAKYAQEIAGAAIKEAESK